MFSSLLALHSDVLFFVSFISLCYFSLIFLYMDTIDCSLIRLFTAFVYNMTVYSQSLIMKNVVMYNFFSSNMLLLLSTNNYRSSLFHIVSRSVCLFVCCSHIIFSLISISFFRFSFPFLNFRHPFNRCSALSHLLYFHSLSIRSTYVNTNAQYSQW